MKDRDLDSLNKRICQKCGLPLILSSYKDKKENSINSEKITINLICKNYNHNKEIEMDFEEYNSLVKDSFHIICRCTFCNNLLIDNKATSYYCYECQKIICSFCIDKHNKEHKCVKYDIKENKCLIHYENNNNEISWWCEECKKNMCKYCAKEDSEHLKNKKILEINNLKSHFISQIKKKQEQIKKKFEIIKIQEKFNKFLIDCCKNDHYFFSVNNSIQSNNSLCNSYYIKSSEDFSNSNINNLNKISNNNKINNLKNVNNKNQINNNYDINNIDNKNNQVINIIYHDANLKFKNNIVNITSDCLKFQNRINGTVILTNDINNFHLVLKYLTKNNIKSKFALIVNGGSSEEIIKFLNNENNNNSNNYKRFFIGACIYGNKYSESYCLGVKKKYSDFYGNVSIKGLNILEYIQELFKNNKFYNEKFKINSLINNIFNKGHNSQLHYEVSYYYGDESKNAFDNNFSKIKYYIQNEDILIEIKNILISSFQIFLELTNKNYEEIIRTYLKNIFFSKFINSLLNNKDNSAYKIIGYFAGNLMHCIVQYGKIKNKGVKQSIVFYNGMQLNIIDLLEYLKNYNKNSHITFPFFFSMTINKNLAESNSKKITEKERKEKGLYSIFMEIKYNYENNHEPSVFEVKELSPFPFEEEFILLPFTFMTIIDLKIDSDHYNANIVLEIIGKKEILEYQIKKSKNFGIEYDKDLKIMKLKKNQEID